MCRVNRVERGKVLLLWVSEISVTNDLKVEVDRTEENICKLTGFNQEALEIIEEEEGVIFHLDLIFMLVTWVAVSVNHYLVKGPWLEFP